MIKELYVGRANQLAKSVNLLEQCLQGIWVPGANGLIEDIWHPVFMKDSTA